MNPFNELKKLEQAIDYLAETLHKTVSYYENTLAIYQLVIVFLFIVILVQFFMRFL